MIEIGRGEDSSLQSLNGKGRENPKTYAVINAQKAGKVMISCIYGRVCGAFVNLSSCV